MLDGSLYFSLMPTRSKKPKSRTASSATPYQDRVRRLRATLRKQELDGLLITNHADIHYLTGFHGEATIGVLTSRSFTLITDFRLLEDVEVARPVATPYIRPSGFVEALKDVTDGANLNRIGFQPEHATVEMKSTLGKGVGVRKLVPAPGVVSDLRLIKDEGEVKLIRKAVKIQQEALLATLDQIGPGMSELEVCALLEYEMKVRGSTDPAFDPIVAAGPNGSKPHATPGKAKLRDGAPLLIDWGATHAGYRSDMTRTFSFTKWKPKMREIYEITREAYLAGIAAVKPGVTCGEVDAAARDLIADAGYGAQFGHSLGHGIGLDVHELPRVNKDSKTVLKPGMIVTIEPGIYLPGVGGVRIEDDILVTEKGHRNLCSLPTDMEWATR